MKVILTQDVRGQGKKGQLIDAAEGYARNFLLPRKLAVLATADAINTMNLKEKARRAELDEPIKAFGTYEVKAKLGYEVSAKFSVSVSEE